MRLTQSDRRKLDLLLRKRLAPVHRITISSSLLVALTISIWLSPEAYARVEDESVQIRLEKTFVLEEEDDTIREYSREELSKENPEAASTVGDQMGDQVVGLIKSVGSSARKMRKHRSDEQTTKEYFDFAAVGKEHGDHNSEANPDNIRSELRKESANAMARETFQKTDLWQRLKKGLDFKLDFAKLFSSKKEKETAASKGKVRYGLILKKIEPDNGLDKARAAVDSTLMEEEMAYAGRAEVEWTIGPITEEPTETRSAGIKARKKRRAGEVLSEDDLEALQEYQQELDEEEQAFDDPDFVDEESETDATVWERGVKPSFGGNLKPAGRNAGAEVSKQQAPGLQITVTQEQGLYEYMTRGGGQQKERYSEYRFKMPIVGTFAIGRRYNDKMDIIRTSAHNILMTKRLPSVSVHYFEQTAQYKADVSHDTDDGLTVTAAARTDADAVSEKARKKKKFQRLYELGLSKRF